MTCRLERGPSQVLAHATEDAAVRGDKHFWALEVSGAAAACNWKSAKIVVALREGLTIERSTPRPESTGTLRICCSANGIEFGYFSGVGRW